MFSQCLPVFSSPVKTGRDLPTVEASFYTRYAHRRSNAKRTRCNMQQGGSLNFQSSKCSIDSCSLAAPLVRSFFYPPHI